MRHEDWCECEGESVCGANEDHVIRWCDCGARGIERAICARCERASEIPDGDEED